MSDMFEASVLSSVKKMLGVYEVYEAFDPELIIHINTALSVLFQLGVTKTPKTIKDKYTGWDELFGDREDIEMVKTFIFMKVKLMFDPPSSSFVLESYNKQIAELEWRLNVAVDPDIGGNE